MKDINIHNFLSNKVNRLFLIMAGFFIVNAVVAEFIGIKIFSLEETLGIAPFELSMFGQENLGFNLTAGVLLWPVVFIMTDIINEYFGLKAVKLLSYITVALIIYAFVMVFGAIKLVPNEWWNLESGVLNDPEVTSMDAAFTKIMGQGLWIIFGSVVAFLVGQLVDVMVFQRLKKMTGGKAIWLRATGSTLVSQFIDSFVVLIIAFYIGADWELNRVLAIGFVNYFYKFFMAIVLTPVLYLAHNVIDNYLGKEVAENLKNQASL